jgi:hypothetical protein
LTRTPLIQSFRSLALGRADAEAASEIGMPRAVGLARRWNFDYKSKIFLDYVTNIKYILPSLLMEGRLLETILKTGRGVASCGRGS